MNLFENARRRFIVTGNGLREAWILSDGTRVPIVSGGDGDTPPTYQELVDERARVLTQIDDVLNTAREAGRSELLEGTVDGVEHHERTEHDALALRADQLEAEIGRASIAQQDAARFARHDARRSFQVPMVNIITTPPATATRSLDELMWATSEDVPAGSYDKAGRFAQHFGARSAVEQITVRDGDGNGTVAPRIDEVRPEHRGAVRAFQRVVSDMVLFGLLIDKQSKSSQDGFEVARSHRLMKPRWEQALRAMDVDTSAEGGTWVPTGIGAELHERVRASGKVAPLFARIEPPTNPWKWPIEGVDDTAFRVPEPTGDTETKPAASTPGTIAATFDAEIFGGRTLFSRSLEADSALAILPYVKTKLVRAFTNAEETCIINGDTDGTHQDSDVGASTTDARTAWDGLRKRGLANASLATTATTAANLALIRKAMLKWGVNPNDLAFIVGVSAMHAILTDAAILTVDKFGPNATIHAGQIGAIFGVPIIVSEFVREDLNASGVFDNITKTKTTNLCVNTQEWAIGQRMALDVEVDDSPYRETYQRLMVGFMREDFQNLADIAGNQDTAIGFNVTP